MWFSPVAYSHGMYLQCGSDGSRCLFDGNEKKLRSISATGSGGGVFTVVPKPASSCPSFGTKANVDAMRTDTTVVFCSCKYEGISFGSTAGWYVESFSCCEVSFYRVAC